MQTPKRIKDDETRAWRARVSEPAETLRMRFDVPATTASVAAASPVVELVVAGRRASPGSVEPAYSAGLFVLVVRLVGYS